MWEIGGPEIPSVAHGVGNRLARDTHSGTWGAWWWWIQAELIRGDKSGYVGNRVARDTHSCPWSGWWWCYVVGGGSDSDSGGGGAGLQIVVDVCVQDTSRETH